MAAPSRNAASPSPQRPPLVAGEAIDSRQHAFVTCFSRAILAGLQLACADADADGRLDSRAIRWALARRVGGGGRDAPCWSLPETDFTQRVSQYARRVALWARREPGAIGIRRSFAALASTGPRLAVRVAAAAREAALRHAFHLRFLRAPRDVETFALVAALRSLEFLTRRNLPLSVATVCRGMAEGASGAASEDCSVPRDDANAIDAGELVAHPAEGLLGMSGVATASGEFFIGGGRGGGGGGGDGDGDGGAVRLRGGEGEEYESVGGVLFSRRALAARSDASSSNSSGSSSSSSNSSGGSSSSSGSSSSNSSGSNSSSSNSSGSSSSNSSSSSSSSSSGQRPPRRRHPLDGVAPAYGYVFAPSVRGECARARHAPSLLHCRLWRSSPALPVGALQLRLFARYCAAHRRAVAEAAGSPLGVRVLAQLVALEEEEEEEKASESESEGESERADRGEGRPPSGVKRAAENGFRLVVGADAGESAAQVDVVVSRVAFRTLPPVRALSPPTHEGLMSLGQFIAWRYLSPLAVILPWFRGTLRDLDLSHCVLDRTDFSGAVFVNVKFGAVRSCCFAECVFVDVNFSAPPGVREPLFAAEFAGAVFVRCTFTAPGSLSSPPRADRLLGAVAIATPLAELGQSPSPVLALADAASLPAAGVATVTVPPMSASGASEALLGFAATGGDLLSLVLRAASAQSAADAGARRDFAEAGRSLGTHVSSEPDEAAARRATWDEVIHACVITASGDDTYWARVAETMRQIADAPPRAPHPQLISRPPQSPRVPVIGAPRPLPLAVDRGALLRELDEEMARPERVSLGALVVLQGSSRAGKSVVALHLAQRIAARYAACVWIECGTQASMQRSCREALALLLEGGGGGDDEASGPDQPDWFAALLAWVRAQQQGRWLVVLDDMRVSPVVCEEWLPADGRCDVVVTTRVSEWLHWRKLPNLVARCLLATDEGESALLVEQLVPHEACSQLERFLGMWGDDVWMVDCSARQAVRCGLVLSDYATLGARARAVERARLPGARLSLSHFASIVLGLGVSANSKLRACEEWALSLGVRVTPFRPETYAESWSRRRGVPPSVFHQPQTLQHLRMRSGALLPVDGFTSTDFEVAPADCPALAMWAALLADETQVAIAEGGCAPLLLTCLWYAYGPAMPVHPLRELCASLVVLSRAAKQDVQPPNNSVAFAAKGEFTEVLWRLHDLGMLRVSKTPDGIETVTAPKLLLRLVHAVTRTVTLFVSAADLARDVMLPIMRSLGDYYMSLGDLDFQSYGVAAQRALLAPHLQNLAAAYEREHLPGCEELASGVFHALGHWAEERGDTAASIQYLKRCVMLLEGHAMPQDPRVVDCTIRLATAFMWLGDTGKMVELSERAKRFLDLHFAVNAPQRLRFRARFVAMLDHHAVPLRRDRANVAAEALAAVGEAEQLTGRSSLFTADALVASALAMAAADYSPVQRLATVCRAREIYDAHREETSEVRRIWCDLAAAEALADDPDAEGRAALVERLVAALRAELGDTHRELFRAHMLAARVYHSQRNAVRRAFHMEAALQRADAEYHVDSPLRVPLLVAAANANRDAQNFARQRELLEQALPIEERLSGRESAEVLEILVALATAHTRLGLQAEKEQVMARVQQVQARLRAFRKAQGEEYAGTFMVRLMSPLDAYEFHRPPESYVKRSPGVSLQAAWLEARRRYRAEGEAEARAMRERFRAEEAAVGARSARLLPALNKLVIAMARLGPGSQDIHLIDRAAELYVENGQQNTQSCADVIGLGVLELVRSRRSEDAASYLDILRRIVKAIHGTKSRDYVFLSAIFALMAARTGSATDAIQQGDIVVRHARDVCGEESVDFVSVMLLLGEVFHGAEDVARERRVLEHAYELLDRVFPTGDDPRMVLVCNALANVYRACGEEAAATPVLARSVRVLERRFGHEGNEELAMAVCLLGANDPRPLTRWVIGERGLWLMERHHGMDDQGLINILQLTEALTEVAEPRPRRFALQQVVELKRRYLGDGGIETAYSLSRLADTYVVEGDEGAAYETLATALDGLEVNHGFESPALGYTLLQIGRAQMALGEFRAAQRVLQRSRSCVERFRQGRTPLLAKARLALAEAHILNEAWAGAEEEIAHLRTIESVAMNSEPRMQWEFADVETRFYLHTHATLRARERAAQGLALKLERVAPDTEEAATSYYLIGLAAASESDPRPALASLELCARVRALRLGANHPLTLAAVAAVAHVSARCAVPWLTEPMNWQQCEINAESVAEHESSSLLEYVLRRQERQLGLHHPLLAPTLAYLGASLRRQRRYADALACFRRAFIIHDALMTIEGALVLCEAGLVFRDLGYTALWRTALFTAVDALCLTPRADPVKLTGPYGLLECFVAVSRDERGCLQCERLLTRMARRTRDSDTLRLFRLRWMASRVPRRLFEEVPHDENDVMADAELVLGSEDSHSPTSNKRSSLVAAAAAATAAAAAALPHLSGPQARAAAKVKSLIAGALAAARGESKT